MDRSRRRETIFIDTNLLLVLLVGGLDPRQVERFKRTSAYTKQDYALLAEFVGEFRQMMTTPNVLTEVSNLLGQLAEPMRRRALVGLGALTGRLAEKYLPSSTLVADQHFPLLGLADTSIIASVNKAVTVLTDDLDLYLRLSTAGVDVVNFNHLRSGSWE
jgi:rRNA-processing protein FCF1